MQDKLSIWSLVVDASFIVQLIMLALMITSFVSWVMIFQRRSVIRSAQRSMRAFEERFWSGADLGQLYREVSQHPNENCGAENIFRAGLKEFTRLTQQGKAEPDIVMNGIQRRMRVAISREEEKLQKHLPFLATVGSTTPYMGLFGTVWGIMNSFRGLATVPHATLPVVAPGIAEALINREIGLLDAIPALIA